LGLYYFLYQYLSIIKFENKDSLAPNHEYNKIAQHTNTGTHKAARQPGAGVVLGELRHRTGNIGRFKV